MMRKNNNSIIYHSFKHYIVSLFITLLYEEFPQYIWTLAIYSKKINKTNLLLRENNISNRNKYQHKSIWYNIW